MKIKIMAYNILHGFRNLKAPYELEGDRLKAAQRIVRRENPDILGLPEACFNAPNPHGVLMDYQRLFGFPYVAFCPSGTEWGCAVLSRYPIINSQPMSNENGNGLRSKISKEGKIINIDLVHPRYDFSEDEKIKFLNPFLENSRKPFIIFGDFNSLSDDDSYDREILVREFRKFEPKRAEEMGGYLLGRRVIPYVKSFGLKDALHEKGAQQPTMPAKRYRQGPSDIRIDYIFHSPDVKVKEAYVVKNRNSDMASDHYPVVAVLEIK